MSPSKHRSLTEVLPRYLIAPGQHADFDAMFGRPGPLFVDIGFGMGESTVALATARPNANILAVDVHIAGHAMLANALADQAIANVRIIAADAHEVLLWMCEPASLTEVSIWFSDGDRLGPLRNPDARCDRGHGHPKQRVPGVGATRPDPPDHQLRTQGHRSG
jgi:tRNA (guanine-N7-)-methyltransferase